MGTRCDFVVSEGCDAVLRPRGMDLDCVFMRAPGVLQRLPRMFLSGQVILLSMLLVSRAMGVRGNIVEFRRPLVIFVMRPVVITCGHT
jgi:hypothetical protein